MIIGVVPAIALSDFADYAIRERVNEGLTLAAAAKVLVNDNAKKAVSDFSRGWTAQEMGGLNHFVNSISISPSTGAITIVLSEEAKNIRILLTPSSGGASLVAGMGPFAEISWSCEVGDATFNKYVPQNCRA